MQWSKTKCRRAGVPLRTAAPLGVASAAGRVGSGPLLLLFCASRARHITVDRPARRHAHCIHHRCRRDSSDPGTSSYERSVPVRFTSNVMPYMSIHCVIRVAWGGRFVDSRAVGKNAQGKPRYGQRTRATVLLYGTPRSSCMLLMNRKNNNHYMLRMSGPVLNVIRPAPHNGKV